jgi:hypothetical protein
MGNFDTNLKLLEQTFRTNVDNGALVEKFKRIKERKKIPKKILDTALGAVNPIYTLSRFVLDKVYKISTDK